jgi:hypothetical protein
MKTKIRHILLKDHIDQALKYYACEMYIQRNHLIQIIADALNEYHRNYFESFWYRLKRLFGGYIKYKKYTFDDIQKFYTEQDGLNKEIIDIRELFLIPVSWGNFTYSFYPNKSYKYKQIMKKLNQMKAMMEHYPINAEIEINDEEFGLIFHD